MPEATLLPGFRSLFAEIDGVSTRYFAGGSGPPLVLVHGLGGAATNWTELAPLLAKRRRVLVPDLPGHGRSDRLARVEGLGSFALRLAALLEQEASTPAALVGHSMGGLVALRLAVARPQAVSALVLVGTAGIVSGTRRAEIALALSGLAHPGRKAARFRHAIASRPRLRRLTFGYWGVDDPAALSPQAALGFLEGAADATDVAAATRALLGDDPRQDLDGIRCPTLLLWGARDRLVPLADGFEFARRLRAPIRALPASGHLVIGERPLECAELIEAFLDRVGKVDELPVQPEPVAEPRG